jgi:hypothetical protein
VDAARRPYPVTGSWERYSFRVGNTLFLMMSDRNDLPPPVGRGAVGGYPAGAVSGETFAWWRDQVADNPDAVIISAHHHMLRETTVGSGDWEGYAVDSDGNLVSVYHGYLADGGPEGASYLYFVDGVPKAMAFERYLEAHPGAIDLWLGGHTHAHPDEEIAGRSHVERRWGVTFVNCGPLTRYHGALRSVPMSRLFTFTDGSPLVRVQCYLHTDQLDEPGFYEDAERLIVLGKPCRFT